MDDLFNLSSRNDGVQDTLLSFGGQFPICRRDIPGSPEWACRLLEVLFPNFFGNLFEVR